MAGNLREINIMTCSSGVEGKVEKIRSKEEEEEEEGEYEKVTEKEEELVFNSVRLNLWSKG